MALAVRVVYWPLAPNGVLVCSRRLIHRYPVAFPSPAERGEESEEWGAGGGVVARAPGRPRGAHLEKRVGTAPSRGGSSLAAGAPDCGPEMGGGSFLRGLGRPRADQASLLPGPTPLPRGVLVFFEPPGVPDVCVSGLCLVPRVPHGPCWTPSVALEATSPSIFNSRRSWRMSSPGAWTSVARGLPRSPDSSK